MFCMFHIIVLVHIVYTCVFNEATLKLELYNNSHLIPLTPKISYLNFHPPEVVPHLKSNEYICMKLLPAMCLRPIH